MTTMRFDLRKVITAAIGIALAAMLLWFWASSNGATAAEPARAAALSWLRSSSTSTCFEAAVADVYFPALTSFIDAQPAGGGWTDKSGNSYVGTDISAGAESMASATSQKGTYAGTDGTHAYLQVTDAKGPAVLKFERATTPKGRVFWYKVSEERPTGEGACDTTQ